MRVDDGLPMPRRLWAVLALMLALTSSVLLGSVVNLSLPIIALQLAISSADVVWVVNAYLLAMLVCLLPFASLGEILGYKRVFLLGAAGLILATILCVFSTSLPLLIASRAMQGVASAAIASVNSAQLRLVFPANQLGRAVGLNAMMVALAGTLGPGIGGLVLSVASWPWLFAMTLPLSALSLLVGFMALPQGAPARRRFDLFGALLNVLSFGLAFLGFDQLASNAMIGVALLAGAGLAMTLLVRQQRGKSAPLLPLDLLARPVMSLALAGSTCGFAAQGMALVCLPFMLHEDWLLAPAQSGWLMLCWPAAVGLLAPFAGRLADRLPTAGLCAAGMVLLASGLLMLSNVPESWGMPGLLACILACGMGFGLFQTPNIRSILTAAPIARSGGASGLQATARQMGYAVGTTAAAMTFRLFPHGAAAKGIGVAAAFAGLAVLFSLLRYARGRAG